MHLIIKQKIEIRIVNNNMPITLFIQITLGPRNIGK